MTRHARGKRLCHPVGHFNCYVTVTGALGERRGNTWRLKTRRLYDRLGVVSRWNR